MRKQDGKNELWKHNRIITRCQLFSVLLKRYILLISILFKIKMICQWKDSLINLKLKLANEFWTQKQKIQFTW